MKTLIFNKTTKNGDGTKKSKNNFSQITFVLTLLLLMMGNFSWGQTTIAYDSFENTATLFGSGGTYKTGTSSATLDRVASSPFAYAGSYALSNSGIASQSVTTGDINTSAYTSVFLTLRVAAFSIGSTANGMETGDYLQIEVSPDGGSNYYPTIKVTGASANNACWAYSATGAPTTAYDGDATAVTTAAATAGTNANGPSLLTITGLPQVSNLRIKITCIGNNAAEKWVFDDFLLKGTPSATPDITLADNGTQIAAANVTAGTSNHILSKFKLDVSTADAIIEDVSVATSGNYQAADINGSGFKLWYNTTDNFSTATAIGSALSSTSTGTGDILTFASLATTISSGGTGYLWVTANISSSATAGRTISVDAIANADISFTTGNKSGSATAGGTQTIVAATSPTITIGSITAFGNQCVNTTSGELTYTVSGTNLTADIALTAPTGYEISKTSGSGFGGSATLPQSGGSVASTTIYVRFSPTLAQPYSGSITHTSTGATQQDLVLSGTGTSPVTPSVAIAVSSGSNPTCPGTSVTFTATPTNGGTPSYQWKKDGSNVGSNSATYTDAGSANGSITCVLTTSLTCVSSATATSNAISLTQSVPNATSPGATAGNAQVSVAWSNPSCYDEIMIVAAPASNNGTPTGDGTAYTGNLAYPNGTALGNGFVVYKGTSFPEVITGLTNGTLYYFKLFTRKGSVWSAGIEVSATPISGPCVTEGFESGVPTSYQTSQTSNTLASGTWSMLNVMQNNSNQHGGSYCAQIKNASGANATMPTNNTVSSVKFWCKAGTAGSNGLKVQKSVSGGAFTDVQTFTITITNTQYTCNINDNSADVVIRFLNSNVGQTLYLDDVELYCGTPCTPPSAPTTTGGSICNSGTVSLSASGAIAGEVYKWYSASTGGTLLKTSTDNTDNTYTTASISTTTNYYVTRFVSATSCESTTRTIVTATVSAAATSIAPAATQNIVISTNGTALTVTETPAATSRVWKYGTSTGSYSTSTANTTTTYTPNFGSAGTYYVVCESTYPAPCGVKTSNEVVINVASNGISTSTISGSPFCAGSSVSVPFTIVGTYTAGNIFTAQLSNSSGDFASPTTIGTISSTTAGTISATIPAGTTTGTGYRIRVVSSTPAITGNDNGTNLTINAQVTPSVTIAITTGTNPTCAGTSIVFTPTPTNGGSPTYQWKVNGTNTLTGSTYTTTTLANNDIVSCVMTTTASCPSAATATSTGITMTVNAVPTTPTGTITPAANPACGSTTISYSGASASIYWESASNGVATSNATTSAFTVTTSGTYYVRAYNGSCWSSSSLSSAAITINSLPAITAQPADYNTSTPATGLFSVTATGTSPTYQWQLNSGSGWGDISGATSDIYETPATSLAMNGYQYRCIVSGTCSPSVTSNAATLSVSSFTYAAGDYRPTADYTNFSYNNNAGATNNWEYYNGSIWTTTPFDKAPSNVEAAGGSKPARIIINRPGIYAAGTTTKTYNDIIIQSGGELYIVDDDAPPVAVEVIMANKKIEVLSGGKLFVEGDIDLPATGALIVRSGGEMTIDQAGMQNDHPMWDGVETFEAGSTVEILNWNFGGTATYVGLVNISNTIANNTNGYKFGNLIVNVNTNSDWAWCGGSYNEIINLAYNDVTVDNAGTGYIGGITNKTYPLGYRINGNLIVNSGNFNFSATYSGDDFEHQAYINGNFTFNSTGILKLHRNAANTPTSMYATEQSFVQFKGNIYVNPAATFTNDKATDNSRMYLEINGSGTSASPQLLDIGVTTGMTGINTTIKNNTFCKLKSHNWIFNGITGLTTALTIETGSSLHFGWADDGTTPLIATLPGGAVGTNTFTTQTGTTLYMTHADGLDDGTTITKGNVQQFTQANRTINQVANFWYIGKTDQQTGSGITTASTNKLIGLDMIDGTKTTTLTNAITTTGKLILKTGVLSTTATNLSTIGAGGSVHTDFAGTNGAAGSATSFVDGPIKKIGNTIFVFPTGDVFSGTRKWARIGISAPTTATTEYTAEYNGVAHGDLSVTTTPFAIDHVSSNEFWNLSQSANDDVIVKLFWEDNVFSDITNCSSTDLRIAHYNGSDWELNIDEATVNCGLSGDITTTTKQPNFSPFTFAFKASQTLPIELLNFNAIRDGKNVNIDWSTASETNNNFFTVERSKDANNFEFVGNYTGAGFSTTLLTYRTTDIAPYLGKSYYRLKQTDYDGKYSFSNIVAVDEIYDGQNPEITIVKVQNSIQIGIENGLNNDYLVRIIDIFGRVLYQENFKSSSEKIIIYMDDSIFARGVYTVAVSSGTTIKTTKIIW